MLSDAKILWRSFVGGEVSEELFARVALPKIQNALALCKNFIVLPHGPVQNRAGTQFVREAGDSTNRVRLIPFERSNGQALVVELGHLYARFHTDGGTVLNSTAPQTVTSIAPATVSATATVFTLAGHGFVDNDEVVLTGFTSDYGYGPLGSQDLIDAYMNVSLTITNATSSTFELTTSTGSPVALTTGINAYETISPGEVEAVASPYEVTTPYVSGDLFELDYAQDVDTLTLTHPDYQQRELVRSADNSWALSTVSFNLTIGPTAAATVDGPAAGSNPITYFYKTTSILNDEESLPGASSSAANDLWTAGHRNKVASGAVSGARYKVYKTEGNAGSLYGLIGEIDEGFAATGILDQNITPDYTVNPPQNLDALESANNYPSCVVYFAQRRVLANTVNAPQSFWMTNTGLTSTMTYTGTPPNASDAFTYKLSSLKANSIRYMMGLKDLLFFTAGNVWRAFSVTGEALTAQTIDAQPDINIGCARVKPVDTSKSVLFANAKGNHLIAINYSNEAGGYSDKDLSVLAPHLIDEMSWAQMAFQESPTPVWWGVRSDGKLIGLTYLLDEQVVAWHQHQVAGGSADDYGVVESIASIPSNNRDVVYLVVKRTINGSTVRYIELIHDRVFSTLDDAFFVDCGLSYSGDPATTISGLDHLEGEEVVILADGVTVRGKTVTSGQITLDTAASKVHIGLSYTSQLKTLPIVYEDPAFGVASRENINGIYMRVKDTGPGIEAGPDFTDMRGLEEDFDVGFGDTPELRSEVVEIPIDEEWADEAVVAIRQSDPVPLTVMAVAPSFTRSD